MRLRKSFWLLPLLVLSCVFFLAASIPNVPTGTWQNWNAMGDVRSGAAAALLQDGRVLIIGGSNTNGPVASAELFGTDGVFSAAAAMQTPRSGHTATVLSDGRVLVTGGATSGGGAVNTAEIYDPSADSWSTSVTMVDARVGHTASLLSDGRVLLAGGHDSAGNALSSLEIFDPTSGTFSSAGAMTSPRMNHAAATLPDGRVLIIGGTPDGANGLASSDIYDPSAGTVSAGPALSTPRMSATATTTLDGKVAVIGGNNGAASGSQDLASAEIFDPATGQFSPSASSLVTARSGHQAFLLPRNNAILIVGGTSGSTDLNSAELYFPWTDSFQTTGAMSLARPGLTGSATGMDGRFLAVGGTNLSSTELYGFATVKTDAADYPPGSTVTITGSGWRPGETVTLTLLESPLIDTHPPISAVADGNGNIFNNQFSPDEHDVNVRFYLTAEGASSQARTTFTDAGPKPTSTITFPVANGAYKNAAWTAGAPIAGTAVFDGGTTGRAVAVSIKRSSTGLYWNGASFSNATETFVPATGTTSWSLIFPSGNFPGDGTYVAHSQATDSNGQEASGGGTPVTFTIDNTPPNAPSAPALAPGSNSGSNADTITNVNTPTFTGTAEANSTLKIFSDGIQVGSGTTANNGSYSVGTSALSAGTHAITATATDAAGNESLLSASSSVTIDTVRPSVTVNQAGGQSDPTSTSPINFTVVFSESVADFATGDVTLSGTAGATTAVVTGSGTTYNVAVSGMTTSGTVIATIGQNAAHDTAANGNTASTSSDNTVQFNSCTSPSVTLNPISQTVTYGAASVSFSAAASGTPAPTVQWQVSTNGGGSFSDIGGATSTTLTISTPTVATSGNQYRAVFTNTCGGTQTATSNAATLTVNKAHLTVTANNAGRAYGDSNPSFTYAISGFVNGENFATSGVSGSASCTTTADTSSAASPPTYPINCTIGSLTAANYDFPPANFIAGALTITKIDATINVTGYSGPYTATPHGATGTATGLLGVNLSSLLHVATTTYTDVPGGLVHWTFDGDQNYNPASGDASVTITKVDATINVTGYSGPYTATAHGASGTATGVVGESLNGLLHVDPTTYTEVPGGLVHWTFDGDQNYNPASGDASVTITKVDATINVTGYSGPYTATPHGASGTATGVIGESLNGLLHVDPTTYTDVPGGLVHWTFDGNTNYNSAAGNVSVTITKVDATINVTGYSGPYTATPHGASGTATGVIGESLNGLLHVDPTTYTDVPGGLVHWTFDGNTNYNSASGNASVTITKVDATINVTGYSGPYTATAHGATGTATGVIGESLNGLLHVDPTTYTNVPGGPVHWTFDGNTNYNSASGDATVTITKVDATINVTGYSGPYTATAHGASGTATGLFAVNLGGLLHVATTTYTDVPGGLVHWTFDGNTNYNSASGDATVTITKIDATINVTGYNGLYTGTAHGATGTATGLFGVNLGGLLHVDPTTYTNVPGGPVHWTFDGNTNYNPASGDAAIVISKANATIVVTPYSVPYDGSAHTATGTAKGVLGESLSGLVLSGTTHTLPGDYLFDPWTFTDVTGNYNNANGTVHDTIAYGVCSSGAGGVILPPINSDGTSVYNRKGGSTIPVKFTVCDAFGNPISNPAAVFAGTGGSLTMLSEVRGTITVVNETATNDIPDVAFRWTGSQWIFNMATTNLNQGSTYTFRINLAYGSISFVVGVK